MTDFSDSQITTIEQFVSHPAGLGYVLAFSDRTFLDWFKDEWQIDIEAKRYRDRGTSKRHRLISFCLQHDDSMVVSVLRALLKESDELESTDQKKVPVNLRRSFVELIDRFARKAAKESLFDGNGPNRASQEPASTGNVTRSVVAKNIKSNSVSLILTAASILEQIADYRECVRSDNQLGGFDPEFRDSLLTFLDQLTSDIEKLLSQIPNQNLEPTPEQEEAATDWTGRFISSAIPERELSPSAENLGKVSAP